MVKRTIKFTPIAASVALTLGLTACGSDNDRNIPVTPVEAFTATGDAQFNIEVTGKAVKGSMKSAVVTVMTLDASGQSVPVAFRSAASAEAESFSEEALSQDAADAAVEASKIAANPEVLTDESGRYSIYLDDDFTGPVYITVKTSAEGDDSFLRCDAYVGCGDYDVAPEADDVNDGDTAIEFGEWYKTDLELSVVKFIPAVEADTSGVSGAAGDLNVASSYKANVTFLTSLVAALLLDSGSSVDEDAIATASLNTVVQVMGQDAALLLSAIIGDLSNGGAVDLSDVDGEEELTDGILAIAQLSSSIQGLPSIGDVMSSIAAGIKSGQFKGNTDAGIAAIATMLQTAITNTANIFVAVATGDETAIEDALKAAFTANNPSATQAQIDAFAANSVGIAAKAKAAKDKAVKNGAATDAGLAAAAIKVKKALEVIGCTGAECTVGDDFYTALAAALTVEITASQTALTTLEMNIETAQSSLADVQAMGGDALTADNAAAFVSAVTLLKNEATTADLTAKAGSIFVKSQGYVTAANALVTQSSDYQQILDSATLLQTDASVAVTDTVAYDLALAALVAEAEAAIETFDVALAAAKLVAEDTADVADEKKSVADTAEAASTSALANAEGAMVDTAANATEALELAMTAVTAASDFAAAVDALEIAIEQALVAANAYLDLEGEGAQAMIDALTAMQTAAVAQGELASEQFVTAYNLQLAAETAVAKLEVLTSVKATSESLSTMTVLTGTGADAVADAADVLADVIDELAEMGNNSGTGTSTRNADWDYAYSLDDLTLMLSNATTGEMINAAASYEGDKLVVAWGATLKGENDVSVELVTAGTQTQALTDCVDFAAGTIDATQIDSCLVFTFDGAVTADNVDDAEILMTETTNHVEIMDGDSGFTGMLSLTADDATDSGSITLEGVSGDVDFKVMTTFIDSDMEEASALDITVNNAMGYTLSITGNESAGYTGDVMAMYNEMMMSFGTAAKTTNGLSITYIDGDVVDYTDVDLIDSSK
ncbi:hypothetical protein ABFV74_09215 [Pseudoalteromonas distincta]|jgi:hypothetical protein|uniref:hypothetical protein n=1 Tax=Pseudoalteromonas TaxID=53246 RepID=UPI0018CD74C1|nr:hypothetical protein [Pseudoalteromonas sp. NSLLW218]MBH0088486.1 hypothetical protein [Pseudoalteromonas sp. NSLLW218]